MKPVALLLFLMCCCLLEAQQVIATQGSTFSNSNGTISFTIGEGIAQTLTGESKALTQGFQQSFISLSSLSDEDPGNQISVYPNPASEIIYVKISREDSGDLQYYVFDLNGTLLIQKKAELPETPVEIKHLSRGMYIIKIKEGVTELKSFKIIKL